MLFCDLHAPLDPEFNPAITYEEAGKLIQDSLQVLGDEYSAIIKKGSKKDGSILQIMWEINRSILFKPIWFSSIHFNYMAKYDAWLLHIGS